MVRKINKANDLREKVRNRLTVKIYVILASRNILNLILHLERRRYPISTPHNVRRGGVDIITNTRENGGCVRKENTTKNICSYYGHRPVPGTVGNSNETHTVTKQQREALGRTSGMHIALYVDHARNVMQCFSNLHGNVNMSFYILSELTLVALNEHLNNLHISFVVTLNTSGVTRYSSRCRLLMC
jgi:hypothetical protein